MYSVYNNVLPLFEEKEDYSRPFVTYAIIKNYTLAQRPTAYTYGNNIFFATTDGFFYFYETYKKWYYYNNIFDMPIITGAGKYLGVWQPSSYNFTIYNSYHGLTYYRNTHGLPILYLTINSYGYVAIILENYDVYDIYVYSPNSYVVFNTTISGEGIFPTGISLGYGFFAISLMDTSHIGITSNVILFDIESNSVVGSTNTTVGIISNIHFAEDRVVIIYSNNIKVVDKNLTVLWYINIYVDDIIIKNETIVLLVDSDVIFLTLQGKELYTHTHLYPITFFTHSHGYVIIGNGHRFIARNYSHVLWEFVSIPYPLGLYFLGDVNTVLLLTEIEAILLQR